MSTEQQINRVDQLIKKGEAVLATHRPNPLNVIGFPTLDSGAFAEWQTQSLSFLKNLLGPDHTYVTTFEKKVERGYTSTAETGERQGASNTRLRLQSCQRALASHCLLA